MRFLSVEAGATCNVIPGVSATFRGALGSMNRPFAIPGDVGQEMQITLRPSLCDDASPEFVDRPGGAGGVADDYFVTVLFEPPGVAPRNAVVLSTPASLGDCNAAIAMALPELGPGGTATCRAVTPDTQELQLLGTTSLVFRFPDTDAQLAPDGDDRTYVGPVTIAVTPARDALLVPVPPPFALANARCAATPGLVACIDELYTEDGTCETGATHIDSVFGHLTALPPANDYQALCSTPGSECTGLAAELRLAVDVVGNALLPIDWRGVLLRPDGIPLPRLIRGVTSFAAFAGGDPIRVPGRSFLASYSPGGRRLPPIFEPFTPPTPSGAAPLVLFGSADAPVGVMRIARRMADLSGPMPVHRACSGGTNDGLPCVGVEECPSGTCSATTCYEGGIATATPCSVDAQCAANAQCGPALFELRDRLVGGVGPVVIPSAQYVLAAENPAPLEGLVETPGMFAFVELEAVAAPPDGGGGPQPADLNGDGDTRDRVLVVRDRQSGLVQAIGAGGADGRAVTRIQDPPFSRSVVAAENDVVAFLESEPLQGDEDANADGDVFDSILRIYRQVDDCGGGAPCAQEMTSGTSLAADAEPRIDGRSVVVSSGRVYFRAREADNADQTTASASAGGNGFSHYAGLNGDGRFVSFTSAASNFVPPIADACGTVGDTNMARDVFVHDRDLDGDGIFDEPGPGETKIVRVSVGPTGCQTSCGFCDATGSVQTPDGRFVLFQSAAQSLTGGEDFDQFGHVDAFARDRDSDRDGIFDEPGASTTVTLGVNSSGTEANGTTTPIALTPDGRFFLMSSGAMNLVEDDNGMGEDVFVLDRDLDADGILDEPGAIRTTLVSQNTCGEQSNGGSSPSDISADGRWIPFSSNASNLVLGDSNGVPDVFLRDRDVDGDWIFDEPTVCTGAPPTPEPPLQVETRLISLGQGGDPGNSPVSEGPSLDEAGRFMVYYSDASNLVAGDTNGVRDEFVRELDTGLTIRVSVASDGAQADDASFAPFVSNDGRFVVFPSAASNLVAGDLPSANGGVIDVFLHDRLTGHTMRVVEAVGGEPNGASFNPAVARDARFVAYESLATNLVPGDVNGVSDVFVSGPSTDPTHDVSGDGRVDDTLLYVFDTTQQGPSAVALGPADDATVAAGSAAFLLPERAHGVDRNGDQDLDDAFVWLSTAGAAAQDLDREAVAIALSSSHLAALVPEPNGIRYLRVYDLAGSAWSGAIGPAAEDLAIAGATVAFRAALDGQLHLYDAETESLAALGEIAEDYVLGERLVAFRSAESETDRNGDADTQDDVLFVYDLVSQQLLETGQAVLPCRFEACDPRLPYRVSGDTVTFLTLEAAQGNQDLDENGDSNGVVIQTFNARKAASGSLAPFSLLAAFGPEPEPPALLSSPGQVLTALAAISAGVCTTSGEACATDADCAPGRCFVPPGGCIESTGLGCTIDSQGGSNCAADTFCIPTLGEPGIGVCHRNRGPCTSTEQCVVSWPTAVCQDGSSDVVRLVAPLAAQADGRQLFASAAVEAAADGAACVSNSGCGPGEICSEAGTCTLDRASVIFSGVPDSDADGVADDVDNCPRRPNTDQADENGNGIGDICDRALAADCSNGLDDDGDGFADAGSDPGCASASDVSEHSTSLACDDGLDDDGDSFADFPADPGCQTPSSPRENPKCQDGLDNDGATGTDYDGGVSVLGAGNGDPNGLDLQCAGKPWHDREAPPPGCGLGAEAILAFAALLLVRRRSRAVPS